VKPTRRFGLFDTLFSIVLLASLILNWFLFIQGRQYYLQLNETRLDPLGLSYYSSDATQQNFTVPSKITVLFFGDSRVISWPPPNLPGFEFINRGIGAQTSAQAFQRFNYHVEPLNPQVIVVQICINDLKTIPIFPGKSDTIVANCKANIRQIVKKSIDIGATVILTTVFPIGKVPLERRLFWSPAVALAIEDVNSYIHSLEAQNVIVFDTYSILVDNGTTRDEFAQDFLHLNETGYAALNSEFVHILAPLE
jgi:lysophospholipase L1-like esterase